MIPEHLGILPLINKVIYVCMIKLKGFEVKKSFCTSLEQNVLGHKVVYRCLEGEGGKKRIKWSVCERSEGNGGCGNISYPKSVNFCSHPGIMSSIVMKLEPMQKKKKKKKR